MSPLKPRKPVVDPGELEAVMEMVALAQAVFPFSVAATLSATVPVALPAVKTVEPPEDELSVPSVFESDHA